MIRNVIFDWSGTLSDDLVPVYQTHMAVFDAFGVPRISLEEYRREFVLPYRLFYEKYIPPAELQKNRIGPIFKGALASVGEPEPFPGAGETLDLLFRNGKQMAVFTSYPQEKLEKEVREYGFSRFFGRVRGSVRDKRETILEIIRDCGYAAEETAYVGDMPHDIEAGKQAHVTTIGVTWGYQPEKLEDAEPDFSVNSFEELREILSREHPPQTVGIAVD